MPRSYPRGSGILTGFSFGRLQLGPALAPGLPPADDQCRGTLAPPAVGILTRLCCYSPRDSRSPRVHRTSRPGFTPTGTPAYRITPLGVPRGIGARLSPVHLRGPAARRVSCYALLRGWLLLSLPPRCLSRGTPFGFTLRRGLGALTAVSVVPVSARELTPRSPSPAFYGGAAFGVRRGMVPSRGRPIPHL